MVSTPQIIGQSTASAESGVLAVPPDQACAAPVTPVQAPATPALDPTRFGDWEKNGRCIDF